MLYVVTAFKPIDTHRSLFIFFACFLAFSPSLSRSRSPSLPHSRSLFSILCESLSLSHALSPFLFTKHIPHSTQLDCLFHLLLLLHALVDGDDPQNNKNVFLFVHTKFSH